MFKRFTAGVAVGYVMGARAGQKRYEQITDLVERAMEIPFVERLAENGRTMAMDRGGRLLADLRERVRGNDDEEGDEEYAEDDHDDQAYDDEDSDVKDVDEDDDAEDDEGESDPDDVVDGYDEEDGPTDEYDDEDDESSDDDGDEDGDYGQDETDEEVDGSDDDEGRSGFRGRLGSLASAARERGRAI